MKKVEVSDIEKDELIDLFNYLVGLKDGQSGRVDFSSLLVSGINTLRNLITKIK